ncbi:hypothetical protein TNCV_3958471 [Trichonephila clavipes]|nr:hypothetical protein TNCV_3958471 [Trichonephila clavipes]
MSMIFETLHGCLPFIGVWAHILQYDAHGMLVYTLFYYFSNTSYATMIARALPNRASLVSKELKYTNIPGSCRSSFQCETYKEKNPSGGFPPVLRFNSQPDNSLHQYQR